MSNGWVRECVGRCPEPCTMFGSILGLCPRDASSNPLPPVVKVKNVCGRCQMSLGRGKSHSVRITDFGFGRRKGN